MDRAREEASLLESSRRLDDYLTVGTNVLASLREQGATMKVSVAPLAPSLALSPSRRAPTARV